eukprot:m.1292102 g.1292102  ORF g.1292102 m.1292102 type:complete len:583 (-) comp24786_c0_seq35:3142-4890(-)
MLCSACIGDMYSLPLRQTYCDLVLCLYLCLYACVRFLTDVPDMEVKFRGGVDPNSKVATIGRGIKLPGMDGRPLSIAQAMSEGLINGRGGAAGDVEYEEDWDEREKRLAEESKAKDGANPQDRLAKMLQASQLSRGITTDHKALGLASVMGGLKMVPKVKMNAPYAEHAPGGSGVPTVTLTTPPDRIQPKIDMAEMQSALQKTGQGSEVVPDETTKAAPTFIAQRREPGLHCVGAGCGGVDEMHTFMDESKVQFGLLRFTVGSGTFQRNKMVFIHFNGEQCSGLHKAKCNKHADKVTEAFGQCAVKLTFEEQDEVGLDNIVKQTKHLFHSDGHMEISISDIKADYESMLTKSRQNEIEALIKGDDDTPKRKTAKEMGVSAKEALDLVNKPMGAFNWALFLPDASDLTLWDAGSLGVGEMNSLLPDDQVLCGLLRMGFGAGKFRRTKMVSIWYVGPNVSAHQKGSILGFGKSKSIERLKAGIQMEGDSPAEFTLEQVIDKVKRAAIIDGDGVDGIGGARDAGDDPFSMDSYYAALEEEVKGNAAYFGEETKAAGGRNFGLTSTIKDVRNVDGKYTWLLVEVEP